MSSFVIAIANDFHGLKSCVVHSNSLVETINLAIKEGNFIWIDKISISAKEIKNGVELTIPDGDKLSFREDDLQEIGACLQKVFEKNKEDVSYRFSVVKID